MIVTLMRRFKSLGWGRGRGKRNDEYLMMLFLLRGEF